VPFKPNATWCPWNFYRTSGDVRANYASVVANLHTTIPYAKASLSRPGCWAYPDMLEVGCAERFDTPGPGLSFVEARTHFAAWAIVSSPLTLSHDVNDDNVTEAIWPIIANKEVIAVNQAWAGHSGSPFKQSSPTVRLSHVNHAKVGGADGVALENSGPTDAPSFEYYYKPLGEGKTAVLLLNHGAQADLTLSFEDVPGLGCSKCFLRCIYEHKDLGSFSSSFVAKAVASHDSRFFVVSTTGPPTV